MPTVFLEKGYRFFFYSNENNEPIHVHIEKNDSVAKFWIQPIKLAKNHGFKQPELNKVIKLLFENQNLVVEAWNEHFGK